MLSAGILLMACNTAGTGRPWPALAHGTVSGQVQSLEGRPIAGATVRVAGGGMAATDGSGRFAIVGVRPSERAAIWVTSDSFATASAAYPVRAGYETVVYFDLIPRAPAQRLDADRGGRITLGRNGSVQIDAGSLVDEDGRPARGSVFITATYVDPADERQVQAAPGNYATSDSPGRLRMLRTYGMVEISAVNESGRVLRLAPDRTATLDWPGPEGEGGNLYRLTARGDWERAGQGGGTIQIPGFGFWNYDKEWNYVCLRVRVRPMPANPVQVRVFGNGYTLAGMTDSVTGIALLPVEPSTTVQIAISPANAPKMQVSTPTAGFGFAYSGIPVTCPSGQWVKDVDYDPANLPQSGQGTGTLRGRASGLYLLSLATQ